MKKILLVICASFIALPILFAGNIKFGFKEIKNTETTQETEKTNEEIAKNKDGDSATGGIADSNSFETKVGEISQTPATNDGSATKIELDQRTLFDRTRRGVVTIKVSVVASRTMEKGFWSGSGFIVDKEKGLIITNAHVAGECTVCSYEIKFGNGQKAEAKLEYLDPCYDFAILSVNPNEIPQYVSPLKISNENLAINAEVYSMGNSANNEFSTYKGYIFDTESILWLKPIAEQSFQFSGLTVPGASGSPVLNTKGEVVGLLYGGKFVSGAALPISYVQPVIDALKSGRSFHRYFCGLIFDYGSIQDFVENGDLPKTAIEEYEKAFPDSNEKALFITRKLSAFKADELKLEPGDIVWKIDDELIGSNLKMIDEIVQKKAGKPVTLMIYRTGKKYEVEVPTYDIGNMGNMKLLSFAGTVFYETQLGHKICLGKDNKGVYISDCNAGSAFADLSPQEQTRPDILAPGAQVVSIDGKDITTIEDIVHVIPSLYKKKVFTVKFTRICGDPQVSAILTKHTPEFAEATLYTFDQENKCWKVKSIKNPKQE